MGYLLFFSVGNSNSLTRLFLHKEIRTDKQFSQQFYNGTVLIGSHQIVFLCIPTYVTVALKGILETVTIELVNNLSKKSCCVFAHSFS